MAMKFGYTILCVDDVEQAVVFYERAFGLKRRVLMPGEYAELATGDTRLAFADRAFAQQQSSLRTQSARRGGDPPPVEICLVTEQVDRAYEVAVAAGATPVKPPEQKPWGQRVSYVLDNNGFLVEVCSPVE
jgi:lactoylglutathione lyase